LDVSVLFGRSRVLNGPEEYRIVRQDVRDEVKRENGPY
jgi:hypothetical protein